MGHTSSAWVVAQFTEPGPGKFRRRLCFFQPLGTSTSDRCLKSARGLHALKLPRPQKGFTYTP